jgi:ribosomal protein S18 acetylase RimI-like enzyme
MAIGEVNGPSDVAEIKTLFEEYARSLGIDLSFQDFERELADLPGAYSRPGGALILATVDGRTVGCVAVRGLDAGRCEMKRLYVRDDARGRGLGRALAEAAIDFARTAGYRAMLLDTLSTMRSAQTLYRELGFREVPPYRHNPVPGASFMELALGSEGPGAPCR